MNDKIEQIFSDLYQTEPGLRQHDAVLKKVVAELMMSKPDTQFDENFRIELRRRLMQMAETQTQKQPLINTFMKRFQIVGASLAVIALVAASVWYLSGVQSNTKKISSLVSSPKITKAGQNAFGSLINLQDAGGRGGGGGGSSADAQNGLSAAPTASGTGSDVKATDPALIAQQPVNFNYVYKGDDLSLIMDKVDVLKRIKNEDNGSDLSNFINKVSFGLLNLNSFDNSKLQNFTFAEDKDLGYMVNVMLNEGTINIYENWEKWQSTYMPCAPTMDSRSVESVCQAPKIDISQVPDDQVLIDAANSFLDQHGIPRGNYGDPVVNHDWRVYYENATDKTSIWIPDTMNIIYPLQLNGQNVFDESGNYSGLNVSVRYTPQIRVSSVYDLTTQNYQSSEYQAETSVDRIMGLVKQGGFRNYYYSDPNGRNVDLELGTPEVSYVKLWSYTNNVSEELLVPSLIFPVLNKPDAGAYYYKKNVVIPLVKEILDNENGGGIMPLAGQGSANVKGAQTEIMEPTPMVTPTGKTEEKTK